MAATLNRPIVIRQRDDYRHRIFLQDENGDAIPQTGVTASAHLRRKAGGALVVAFSCTVDEAAGKIEFFLSDTETGALERGAYVYDVQLTGGATGDWTVQEGPVEVEADVTHAD